MLVLGDSYSAGNGSGGYYGASGCRRSAYNYARQYERLVEVAPYNQRSFVENAACSGAVTADFFTSTPGRPAQNNAVNPGYDIVFLTIGGNDLGFGDIVKKCLIQVSRDGADCDKLLANAERLLSDGTIERRITMVLNAVRQRADPRAKIVLLGYPYLEGDPNYRLRSGHFGNTFIDVGKRLRHIGDVGDTVQTRVVTRLNSPPQHNNFVFVNTKDLFEGPPNHELFAQKSNPNRWFIQPWSDSGYIEHDTWYHPNPMGWLQEASLLLGDPRIPKHDINGA